MKWPQHTDVRFYYPTYRFLIDQKYLPETYNRLFTCCERKIFGAYHNAPGEIIVAASCCSICEKVKQSPEFSQIDVKYLIDDKKDDFDDEEDDFDLDFDDDDDSVN